MSSKTLTLSLVVAMLGLLFVGPRPAEATDKYWNTAYRTGTWMSSTKWSPSGVPTAGDNVYLNNTGFGSVTVTYDHIVFPTPIFNSLQINATGSGNFTLSQRSRRDGRIHIAGRGQSDSGRTFAR